MRRQTPVAHVLYAYLYPQPKQDDPPNFSAHLARYLVPEVRIEVATFYGDLSTIESRYPGLNYCHPPHRMRLGRFPHHRKLFQAFDAIGLTEREIQDFCCWEGTRWARERYEKDEGIKVKDTTGEEIGPWVDRRAKEDARRSSITRKTDIEVVVEDATGAVDRADEEMSDVDDEVEEDEDEAEEEEQEQEREEVHQEHIIANAALDSNTPSTIQRPPTPLGYTRLTPEQAARFHLDRHVVAAWEQGTPLHVAFEQYLKEQNDRLAQGIDVRPELSALVSTSMNLANGTWMPDPPVLVGLPSATSRPAA